MGHIEMVKLKSEYSRGFPKTTLGELIFAVTNFRGRLFWEISREPSFAVGAWTRISRELIFDNDTFSVFFGII